MPDRLRPECNRDKGFEESSERDSVVDWDGGIEPKPGTLGRNGVVENATITCRSFVLLDQDSTSVSKRPANYTSIISSLDLGPS
jgi:hypothetical protein